MCNDKSLQSKNDYERSSDKRVNKVDALGRISFDFPYSFHNNGDKTRMFTHYRFPVIFKFVFFVVVQLKIIVT